MLEVQPLHESGGESGDSVASPKDTNCSNPASLFVYICDVASLAINPNTERNLTTTAVPPKCRVTSYRANDASERTGSTSLSQRLRWFFLWLFGSCIYTCPLSVRVYMHNRKLI